MTSMHRVLIVAKVGGSVYYGGRLAYDAETDYVHVWTYDPLFGRVSLPRSWVSDVFPVGLVFRPLVPADVARTIGSFLCSPESL